jgi:hypothetical protein
MSRDFLEGKEVLLPGIPSTLTKKPGEFVQHSLQSSTIGDLIDAEK